MAKRGRRKGRRGTGSVLQVRQLSGLGALNRPGTVMGSLLPVGIGAVVAGGTMIGIRAFMTPTTQTQANIMQYAPWIGLAAGGVAGLALWNLSSESAGLTAIAAAAALTVATVAGEAVAKARLGAPKTAGLGAIVPEYQRRGTGVVLMERAGTGDAAKGANINLGRVNTAAFGTPGFMVG